MRCDEQLLEDYIEGFLTGTEKTALETHVTECLTCQQTLENLKMEQRLLATALNEEPVEPYPATHVLQNIQQHKQKKARRQRYNMLFITAAIVMISVVLLATLKQPSQLAEMPVDNPLPEQQAADEASTYGIPLNAGPILNVNIDSVVENNGMEKITYHVKYNDVMQNYADTTFQKLIDTYQLDPHNLPYGAFHALISSTVRNSQNEVIAAFDTGENESNSPTESLYSQLTEVHGEQIKHFSLPLEKNPTTFEISSYFAEVPTFTEPITFKHHQPTTFDYLGHTYTIDDTQIIEDGLQLSIHVEGNPTIIPSKWYITFDGTNHPNMTFHKTENNETRLTVIVPQIKTIPKEMTLLPYLGLIEETFTPALSLQLK